MKSEQVREFECHGLTCVRAAVDAETVRSMRDRIWEETERRLEIRRGDASTWERVPPSLFKRLRESAGLFEPMMSAAVCEGIDALLGAGNWQQPRVPGQLLMSAPDAVEWALPHAVWRTDFPAPGWVDDVLPGVQLFVLLDRQGPRQGGTLFVGGSHRLIQDLPEREEPDYPGRSAQLRTALRQRVPWLRELWQAGPAEARRERFMAQATDHEGVPLRILETTGDPGDVFFMHPWLLHAGSPNNSGRMRIVATERVLANGVKLYRFNRDVGL